MNKESKNKTVIILSQRDYKDNDVIVNALSDEGEYLSFYAKGIKKVTSKNAFALQPFTLANIDYFDNPYGLSLLKTAKSLDNYFNDYQDYQKIISGYILLDVTCSIANLNVDNNQELYNLLKSSLIALKDQNNYLLLSYFLSKIMNILGISVVFEACAICGSSKVNYISVENGGFICHNCLSDNNKVDYSLEVLELFRFINIVELKDLNKLKYKNSEYKILLEIIYEFYLNYSGFYIKNMSELLSV